METRLASGEWHSEAGNRGSLISHPCPLQKWATIVRADHRINCLASQEKQIWRVLLENIYFPFLTFPWKRSTFLLQNSSNKGMGNTSRCSLLQGATHLLNRLRALQVFLWDHLVCRRPTFLHSFRGQEGQLCSALPILGRPVCLTLWWSISEPSGHILKATLTKQLYQWLRGHLLSGSSVLYLNKFQTQQEGKIEVLLRGCLKDGW